LHHKETDKLSSKSLKQWPTYSSTLRKLTEEDGQKDVYQLQKLRNITDAKVTFEGSYKHYCSKVTDFIKQCLEWFDLQLFRDIIEILATQGWQKNIEEMEDKNSSSSTLVISDKIINQV